MAIDDAIRQAAGRDVPWDEVRERRVLGRIRAERAELSRRRRTRPRWRQATLWSSVAAALLVVGWAGWTTLAPSMTEHEAKAPQLAEQSVTTPAENSTTRFSDGSSAMLGAGAKIELVAQSPTRIELEQLMGTVRYEVRPEVDREFIVRAGATSVRVVGTVFTVVVDEPKVTVSVERGRVEVEGPGPRRALLGPDDKLELSTVEAAPPTPANVEPESSTSEPTQNEPEATASPRSKSRSRPRPARREAKGRPDPSSAPPVPTETAPSPAERLRRVDEARARGDWAAAADELEAALKDPAIGDARASALFTLGRIERRRGRVRAAARAYERCFEAEPRGALAEDALAEAARAWSSAGETETARHAAARYLERWPQGSYADAMRGLGD